MTRALVDGVWMFRIGTLALCATTLSGCVAAAIPLAAGGLMMRTATDGEAGPNMAAPAPARIPALAPARIPAPVRAARQTDTAPSLAVPRTAPTGMPSQETQSLTILETHTLPRPTANAQASQSDRQSMGPGIRNDLPYRGKASRGFDPYARLVTYARTNPLHPDTKHLSAVLRDPASLKADRIECVGKARTVLIDLDPAGGLVDPGIYAKVDPRLALHLASLRRDGLAIAWISEHAADSAGDIRDLLSRTGLDPRGHDELVLMRYPADRKQTRRAELAGRTCLFAIAGDSRSDFDELFDYIVDPVSALELEPVLDDGWFLIPPIFTSGVAPS